MAVPIILINAVGLSQRLLSHAPRLSGLVQKGWIRPLEEVLPAVTCTAQATLLTGETPSIHGIVGNGWLYRDTQEIRFWQQSNRLIQSEPLYTTARVRATERGRSFSAAKLFWWFNQGADVDFSVTPKPHYGIDGNKVFGITGTPPGLSDELETKLGPFPFHTFWGPMAGLPCTEWIAKCAARVIQEHKPDLTLVYLPHLDYDPQRFGPSGCDMAKLVKELDDACLPIMDAAQQQGAEIWVVSEYGHCDVNTPVFPNRALREAGLLTVRSGPFGEQLDLFNSRAFAVCDHQLAHVYVDDPDDEQQVTEILENLPGTARVVPPDEREDLDLLHDRSGEFILLAEPTAWFAYPFWLDDRQAPDYARSVAIHHKPGYDPCELFFDPKIWFPKMHAVRRLIQKKLGFRMKMDVVPLDATLVKGSHGLRAEDGLDKPILIGAGPPPGEELIPMTAVRELLLRGLDLSE